MVELLKQDQYDSYTVEKQIASIYAGTKGFLDEIPVEQVRKYEKKLLSYIEDKYPALLEEIKKTQQLPEQKKLEAVITEFTEIFKKGLN